MARAIKLFRATVLGIALVLNTAALPNTSTHKASSRVLSNKELTCLAKNVYFESRGEPTLGKVAIAQVTMNRAKHDSKFKSTICGVVNETSQFSWTAKRRKVVKDEAAWEDAKNIAASVAYGYSHIPGFNALYFHTRDTRPYWSKSKKVVKVIGNHIFYS